MGWLLLALCAAAPGAQDVAVRMPRDFPAIQRDMERETEALAPLADRLKAMRASYADSSERRRLEAERAGLRAGIEAGVSRLDVIIKEGNDSSTKYDIKRGVAAFAEVLRGSRPQLTQEDVTPHLEVERIVDRAERLRDATRGLLAEDGVAFQAAARRDAARRTMLAAVAGLAGGVILAAALFAVARRLRRGRQAEAPAQLLGPKLRRTLPEKR